MRRAERKSKRHALHWMRRSSRRWRCRVRCTHWRSTRARSPNAACTRSRASPGERPSSISSRSRSSIWNVSSSRTSSSGRRPNQLTSPPGHHGLKGPPRARVPLPRRAPPSALTPGGAAVPSFGEAVVLRPALVLARPPLRSQQAVTLEAMERRIEGTLLDRQRLSDERLDRAQDAKTMGPAPSVRSESVLRMRRLSVP